MRVLTPLYKIPRAASAWALLKYCVSEFCPSCQTKRRHWFGRLEEHDKWQQDDYVYVCLRCGQVSRWDKQFADPYYTIRFIIRTASEAKTVREIIRGRKNIWDGAGNMYSDGAIWAQYGTWDRAARDELDAALRAVGFHATWEKDHA